MIDFEIKGAEELKKRLENITSDLKMKGGRSALRSAANVLRNDAISNAKAVDDSKTEEEIAKNIVVRWSGRTFKRTGDIAFRVGVLGGARATKKGGALEKMGELSGKGKDNPGGATWYWRFLEFGTSRSLARPFMRKAMNKTDDATAAFIKAYNKALDKALKK